MSYDTVQSQIRSLEMQLTILKKQVEQRNGTSGPHKFVELYGIAGPNDISEEEIDAVLYRFDAEGFDGTDEAPLSAQ